MGNQVLMTGERWLLGTQRGPVPLAAAGFPVNRQPHGGTAGEKAVRGTAVMPVGTGGGNAVVESVSARKVWGP